MCCARAHNRPINMGHRVAAKNATVEVVAATIAKFLDFTQKQEWN